VDYFSPCIHELSRIFKRANCRARIALTERKLAKAEENLGLLGWQQADFDEATQRQVDSLQNIEREQANLTNRSAELAHELSRLSEHRVRFRGEYDQQRGALESERNTARKPLADLERRLHITRDNTPDVDRRTVQLDRELREVEELSDKLLAVQPQPLHVRDEMLRLRERVLAIQNERNDLKTQHARSLGETHHLEQQIAAIEKRTAEFDKKLRELKAKFEEEDEKLADEERQRAKEKETAETEVNDLERAKGNPYRAIGRVLADNGIAPMNQPTALANVVNLRDKIAGREAEMASLLQQTRSMNRTQFGVSLGLWALILVAGLLVLAALL
jgi:chromosome segregation ATPase